MIRESRQGRHSSATASARALRPVRVQSFSLLRHGVVALVEKIWMNLNSLQQFEKLLPRVAVLRYQFEERPPCSHNLGHETTFMSLCLYGGRPGQRFISHQNSDAGPRKG